MDPAHTWLQFSSGFSQLSFGQGKRVVARTRVLNEATGGAIVDVVLKQQAQGGTWQYLAGRRVYYGEEVTLEGVCINGNPIRIEYSSGGSQGAAQVHAKFRVGETKLEVLEAISENYVARVSSAEEEIGVTLRGYNGEDRLDEIAGKANWQDYGMRMYDPRLGRFPSPDPLTSKYPMLAPYQFANNMPTWAVDLDGLEAAIFNKNDESITIVANVFVVGVGGGRVDGRLALESETNRSIQQQMGAINEEANGFGAAKRVNFKINYFNKDNNGNDFTLESAREYAANSSVMIVNRKGETQTVSNPAFGVVVRGDHLDELGVDEYARYERAEDGSRNEIILQDDGFGMEYIMNTEKEYSHELGHFLGVFSIPEGNESFDHPGVGGTGEGITSRDKANIRMTGEDVKKIIRIAPVKGDAIFGEYKPVIKN